jgi:hypothetical protein
VDDRFTRRNDGRKLEEKGRTEEEKRNNFKFFWEEKGGRKWTISDGQVRGNFRWPLTFHDI